MKTTPSGSSRVSAARQLLVFGLLLTGLGLQSCAEILNTHSSGIGPAGPGPLAGAPEGDLVAAEGNVIFNGGNIDLLADGSTPPARVDLVPGGKPHNTSEYSLRFSGIKLTTTAQPVLAVDAIDDGGRIACGLEIAGGEFRLIGGAGAVIADTYTGAADEHRIVLRMDKATDRCFVLIEQVAQGTDGPPIKPAMQANVPFVNVAFDELDRVQVQWEQTSPRNATQYFLGPAVITRRN